MQKTKKKKNLKKNLFWLDNNLAVSKITSISNKSLQSNKDSKYISSKCNRSSSREFNYNYNNNMKINLEQEKQIPKWAPNKIQSVNYKVVRFIRTPRL